MGLILAEITMEIEDTFEVEWPDSTAYKHRTVRDLRRIILEQLADAGRLIDACAGRNATQSGPASKKCWAAREAWEVLRSIIHHTGDVPLERIAADARLAQDLGLD